MENLKNKVLAINLLNKYSKNILQYEINHFSQFLGHDIYKNDLTIKKKYQHEKHAEITGTTDNNIKYSVDYFFKTHNSWLSIEIKVCIVGGSYENGTYFCIYEKQTFYPFKITNNKLEIEANAYGTNGEELPQFNADELRQKAEKVREIARQYEKQLSEIDYQFRSILNLQKLSNY